VTVVVVDDQLSNPADSPAEQVFISGSKTPVMYRSREKLERIATGRLCTPEEADSLGMEI